jgi:hypothetical protein
MSLTESKEIDRVEIVGLGVLQVREATTIFKGEQEVARTFHRWVFAPGDDVSFMPVKVQQFAAVAWTPEVIAAYQQAQAEVAQRIGGQP